MTLATEALDQRPETALFAFGHAFYGLNSTVYFSQLIERNDFQNMGKCYSINDPTAETFNTPLDSDGGTIEISEANRVLKLSRMGPGVVVFSENGVWFLSGGDDGWKPTSFSLQRVSESGLVSAESAVEVEGSIYYWSDTGIHVLRFNEFNVPVEVSITDSTIKTFYQQIRKDARESAAGVYDRQREQVSWTYLVNIRPGSSINNRFDKELIYDIRLQAFYPQTYKSFGNISTASAQSISFPFIQDTPGSSDRKRYIYSTGGSALPLSNSTLGFCKLGDRGFLEWGLPEGDYSSYIQTAYETLGAPANRKNTQGIYSFFEKTEQFFVDDGEGNPTFDFPSGCSLSVRWDWSITSSGNKWFDANEVYRFRRWFTGDIGDAFDDGESVVTTKTSIRGRGNTLSLRFESRTGKDFRLLGYTLSHEMAGKF